MNEKDDSDAEQVAGKKPNNLINKLKNIFQYFASIYMLS